MTVQKTSGKLLLTLYYLHIEDPTKLEKTSIAFVPRLKTNTKMKSMLHEISDNDNNLMNSFNYLLKSGLIANKGEKEEAIGALIIIGLHLTPRGIDTIEGIEQSSEKKKAVKSLFNINVTNNMSVESLIKAEVGNIVGIGGGISGKVLT